MKIEVTDKQGSGIMLEFAKAIGATIRGRFVCIPENRGTGYITGFKWGEDLRMMIRNYSLIEDIVLERRNEFTEGQDHVVFLINGIFDTTSASDNALSSDQPHVSICLQSLSSVITMPSHTSFRNIAISTSRSYLKSTFSELDHPIVTNILDAKDNFVFETGISPEMIKAANEILNQVVPENLESHFNKLKCEELICYIFSLLIQRESIPLSNMHIQDIKAIYGIKAHLQTNLDQAPKIASLAKQAGMSEPKMRKLFKQTFGKAVFEYYQYARMQQAAHLLKNKLTVSEVGYQLGFTNLSHFSRVFEQHIGIKPKRYSLTLE